MSRHSIHLYEVALQEGLPESHSLSFDFAAHAATLRMNGKKSGQQARTVRAERSASEVEA
jgi:hypothetical protein